MFQQLSKNTTRYGVQVNNACVRLLYSHATVILTANYAISLLVVLGLWQWFDVKILFSWLAGVYLLTTLRLIMVIRFRRDEHQKGVDLAKWGRYFTVSSFLSGVTWGIAGWLFLLIDNPFLVTFVSIFIVAMCAGGLPTLSTYGYAYEAYMIPAIAPVSFIFFTNESDLFFSLGLMAIGFVVAFLMFSRIAHKTTVDAITLNFKNESLIAALKTEKDRAEKARKEAELASISKTQFLAAASHDLRQPLHALNLFLDSLHQRLGGQQSDLVEKCKSSAAVLNQLLVGLLDMSKLDAGVVKPELSNFDLLTIFDSLRRDFTPLAQERRLRLRIRERHCIVRSDPAMVERILRNLVNNALKYTEQGGVLLACRNRGEKVRVEVWDTGIGISDTNLAAVFDEFTQLDNPERDRNKGLGLGLAIVKRLCELLHTTIQVNSTPGRGSRFWFELPLSDQEPDVVSDRVITADPLMGFCIVVIDDDKAILDAMESLLSGWGVQVVVADSGPRAVEMIHQRRLIPDIVISDYRLRNQETGLAAIRLIHEEIDPDISGILLTGDTSPDRIREARQSGFLLLHKPVKPIQLRTAIYQSMQQRSLQ